MDKVTTKIEWYVHEGNRKVISEYPNGRSPIPLRNNYYRENSGGLGNYNMEQDGEGNWD